MDPIFSPLQTIVIISGINRPVTARFVGKSLRNYIFERVTVDGRRYKNGNLINIQKFHFGSDKINGKQVIVTE
ncbi:MAG: hypothetical protein WC319_03860 [Candidatus Paceibacterota bacterium]|jgi:hypothetical protein